MNADKVYIQEQPEGVGEFLFACFCAPCYACVRTRYALTVYMVWTLLNIVIWSIMGMMAKKAVDDVTSGMDTVTTEGNLTMSQNDDTQMLMGDVAVSQPSVAQNVFEFAKVSVPLTSMAMGMILFKMNKSHKKSDHDLFERLN